MLIWFLPVFLVFLMIGLPVFFGLLAAPGLLLLPQDDLVVRWVVAQEDLPLVLGVEVARPPLVWPPSRSRRSTRSCTTCCCPYTQTRRPVRSYQLMKPYSLPVMSSSRVRRSLNSARVSTSSMKRICAWLIALSRS